jgi:hypothetical protein
VSSFILAAPQSQAAIYNSSKASLFCFFLKTLNSHAGFRCKHQVAFALSIIIRYNLIKSGFLALLFRKYDPETQPERPPEDLWEEEKLFFERVSEGGKQKRLPL